MPDRLCQIIRQHELDPNPVKSYATEFCGVKALREATREQVENFVAHLADWAEKNRNALLCQLNSYLSPKEGAASVAISKVPPTLSGLPDLFTSSFGASARVLPPADF